MPVGFTFVIGCGVFLRHDADMPRFLFLLLSLAFMVLGALAVNSLEQNFTCPICGNEWKERVETSSRPNGMRLDLRQLGDIVDPPTLPQCPKCRFVLFTESLNDKALAKLKPFVQGQDYQILAGKSPTYFCLAQIQQCLGAPPRFVGQSYLRAAWQVEDKQAIATRYLAAAEEKFTAAMAAMKQSDKPFSETALLRGEVLRRLGKWDDAQKQFRDLGGLPEFQDARRKQILAQQLGLIARKDNQPQQLREPGAAGGEPEMLPDPEPISILKANPNESK
jgi:hypothetical protein